MITSRPRTGRVAPGGNALRRHGGIAAIYALITLLYTYPLARHPRSAIIGQVDALENYWNLWWTREALIRLRQNPWHVTWMHFPFELPLYFHTYDSVNAVLSVPLQLLFGTAAAYNLLVLFAFMLAALGAYSLAWHRTQHRPASFIAGLIFAFCPYMAFHADVGQPFMQMIGWLPLYLLALLLALNGRSRALPVTGLLLAVTAYTDWHLAVFALTMTAVVGIDALVGAAGQTPPARYMGAVIGRLAVVGAIFTLVMLPLLLPMLREVLNDPYATRPLENSIQHSTDLLSFLLPSPFHPLWGRWAGLIFYGRLVPVGILGGIASVGYGTLLLSLAGLRHEWRRGRLFWLILGVGAVLALGPYLQVNGVNSAGTGHPIPLPYLLFHRLPFMDVLRIPSRFVALAMLGLAMLAGLGVRQLWNRPEVARLGPAGQRVLLGVLAGVIMFEYWPMPFRTTPTAADQVSPFYVKLGQQPDTLPILEVPYLEHRSLFFQTYHHQPTVGGRIARPKLHPWFWARFFGPLIQVSMPHSEIGVHTSPADWRAALTCQNVRYVVFYKQALSADQGAASAALEQAIFTGVAPRYEDSVLRAYGPLAEPPREAFWMLDPAEWYNQENSPTGISFRWLKGSHSSFTVYPCGRTTYTLAFKAYGLAQPRTLTTSLNGQVVSTVQLAADAVTPIRIPITLHDGANVIGVDSPEAATPASVKGAKNDARQLRVNIGDLSILP